MFGLNSFKTNCFTSPLLREDGEGEQSHDEQQSQQEEDEAPLQPRQALPFLQTQKQTAEPPNSRRHLRADTLEEAETLKEWKT